MPALSSPSRMVCVRSQVSTLLCLIKGTRGHIDPRAKSLFLGQSERACFVFDVARFLATAFAFCSRVLKTRAAAAFSSRARAQNRTHTDLFFCSIARSRPSLFGFIHCQHGGPRSNAACRGAWCVVSQLRFPLNSATAKPRTSTPGLLACPPLPRTPEHRRRPGLLACSLCVLPLTSERFRSGRGRLRGRREPHEQPKSQCESREF